MCRLLLELQNLVFFLRGPGKFSSPASECQILGVISVRVRSGSCSSRVCRLEMSYFSSQTYPKTKIGSPSANTPYDSIQMPTTRRVSSVSFSPSSLSHTSRHTSRTRTQRHILSPHHIHLVPIDAVVFVLSVSPSDTRTHRHTHRKTN
jgi:hypothetical protein